MNYQKTISNFHASFMTGTEYPNVSLFCAVLDHITWPVNELSTLAVQIPGKCS